MFVRTSRILINSNLVKKNFISNLPTWATVDPYTMSGSSPAIGENLCNGKWLSSNDTIKLPDPLNGEEFMIVPNVSSKFYFIFYLFIFF